ncbi:hypothetical protein PVAP13_2KG213682 [Panicum virgatum]|uniref:Uncharacterized protein n=1 Tax=Panicum virgatum TaxID=38727 RepID=A0A8T0WI26_PANVG|nr:hypothetical protein PVAP13_2KG213682 [Panicum virgatum]
MLDATTGAPDPGWRSGRRCGDSGGQRVGSPSSFGRTPPPGKTPPGLIRKAATAAGGPRQRWVRAGQGLAAGRRARLLLLRGLVSRLTRRPSRPGPGRHDTFARPLWPALGHAPPVALGTRHRRHQKPGARACGATPRRNARAPRTDVLSRRGSVHAPALDTFGVAWHGEVAGRARRNRARGEAWAGWVGGRGDLARARGVVPCRPGLGGRAGGDGRRRGAQPGWLARQVSGRSMGNGHRVTWT